MQIIQNINDWKKIRQAITQPLGFVPTMGNLHIGHSSLIKKSTEETAQTIVSIFINPTQFNVKEDFNNYPKSLENDIALLENLNIDYLLLPTKEDIYVDNYKFQLQFHESKPGMENLYRPNHFTGVLTVVMKLFNLVKPNVAYFGEKDYQQCMLVHDMVKAMHMDIEIKSCPTIREASGLAYSSRNNRLSSNGKKLADNFAKIFHSNHSMDEIAKQLNSLKIKIEYLTEQYNRRFIAVIIENIRLIDNYALAK